MLNKHIYTWGLGDVVVLLFLLFLCFVFSPCHTVSFNIPVCSII